MIQPSPESGMNELFRRRRRTYSSRRRPDVEGRLAWEPCKVSAFPLPCVKFNEHTPQSVETSKAFLSILCIQARSAT